MAVAPTPPDAPGAAPHRVGRMRVELSGTDEAGLLAVRAGFVDGVETWLAAALEAALDRVAPGGEVLRIDRLEVDLGQIASGPDPGTFDPDLLVRALCDALPEAVAAAAVPDRTERPARATPGAAEHGFGAALSVFLHSGRLPWWTPVDSLGKLEAQITALPEAEVRVLVEALRPALATRHGAERVLIALAPEAARRIVTVLMGEAADQVLPARTRAPAGGLSDPARPDRAVAVALIRAAAAGGALKTPPTDRNTPETEAAPTDNASRTQAEEKTPRPPFDPDTLIGAVPLAGLVLLHPFLPRFLNGIGCLDGDSFRDRAAQHRAVQALAFLARGGEACAEPDLPVAKLLCGLALAEPVARVFDLNDAARAAADELLAAVITHWSALGHASPRALRETFLQRDGRLSDEGRHWSLQVERSGTDVLVGRLPWGLGAIRLAWMEKPLMVDWV